jgi:hypothetical protein
MVLVPVMSISPFDGGINTCQTSTNSVAVVLSSRVVIKPVCMVEKTALYCEMLYFCGDLISRFYNLAMIRDVKFTCCTQPTKQFFFQVCRRPGADVHQALNSPCRLLPPISVLMPTYCGMLLFRGGSILLNGN